MKNGIKCPDESCAGTLYPANVSIDLNESLRMDYPGVPYCICCGCFLIKGEMLGRVETVNYLVMNQFRNLGLKPGKLEMSALRIEVKGSN